MQRIKIIVEGGKRSRIWRARSGEDRKDERNMGGREEGKGSGRRDGDKDGHRKRMRRPAESYGNAH